jgi:hypothetical protein
MRIIQEELGGDSVSKEVKRLREKSDQQSLLLMQKKHLTKNLPS